MEQLTKNQAVATSQEAVQNQNEPQLRDENAHNDKSVHGVLNPTYQAGLRRDAVQPDIEAERKKRDEIEAGKSYCSRRFGGATRYAPSYVSPAYHLLEGFPFIQEPPSGDLQERVLIRHHDYDQCFQSVQLLQWNSQVKFNVTVYRNLPTTRDSIMTS